MKISEILNKDKQNAIRGNCKQVESKEVKQPKWVNPWEGMSDEEVAKAKGITVKELERLRARRARHHRNRRRRAAEEKRMRWEKRQNGGLENESV